METERKPRYLNPYAEKIKKSEPLAFNAEDCLQLNLKVPQLFESYQTLTLEIGCSNGEFLSKIAHRNSHQAFLGIDWKYKIIHKAALKASRLDLKNISFLRTRALDLPRILPKHIIDDCLILFPDPWAKKGQLKNRLLNSDFLKMINPLLKSNALIHFKTDHPGYFQWVLSLFGVNLPELADYAQIHSMLPKSRSMSAKQILVRKPMLRSHLPAADENLKKLFRVEIFSVDYWNDKNILTVLDTANFAKDITLFEKGFLDQKLPIYYVMIRKIEELI